MRLTARDAVMGDAALLWGWANDPETRANAFEKTEIPYEDHVAWLGRRLASPATRMWIFSEGAEPIGQVRLDIEGAVAEVSISVAPGLRGRGYGKAMLREAMHRLRHEFEERVRPRALVLEHNLPSLRLFKACHFVEVGSMLRGTERALVLEPGDLVPEGR